MLDDIPMEAGRPTARDMRRFLMRDPCGMFELHRIFTDRIVIVNVTASQVGTAEVG